MPEIHTLGQLNKYLQSLDDDWTGAEDFLPIDNNVIKKNKNYWYFIAKFGSKWYLIYFHEDFSDDPELYWGCIVNYRELDTQQHHIDILKDINNTLNQ